jgi:hypothetical protein
MFGIDWELNPGNCAREKNFNIISIYYLFIPVV